MKTHRNASDSILIRTLKKWSQSAWKVRKETHCTGTKRRKEVGVRCLGASGVPKRCNRSVVMSVAPFTLHTASGASKARTRLNESNELKQLKSQSIRVTDEQSTCCGRRLCASRVVLHVQDK